VLAVEFGWTQIKPPSLVGVGDEIQVTSIAPIRTVERGIDGLGEGIRPLQLQPMELRAQ
jgi:hypothetical protein